MQPIYIFFLSVALGFSHLMVFRYCGSPWEYGKLKGSLARRHRFEGHVQFIIWPEGYVSGEFTYPEDWWVNYDSSHWDKFQKYEDVNFDQR